MVAREFGLIDYVVSGIHLGMLLALLCGGLYLIYRGIKNQKI
jgi:branched-subunit amino acid ABC-type transport system permease component